MRVPSGRGRWRTERHSDSTPKSSAPHGRPAGGVRQGDAMRVRRPSLDVFRGALVAVLLLVEWLLPSPAYSWLRHSPWTGIRIADLVFPGFLFLVGASMAVGRARSLVSVVRRALTLVVLGFLFNAWGDSGADLSHLRLPGVLQMI